MNMIFKTVTMKEQPFLTQGDWQTDKDGNMVSTIAECEDWRFWAIVAIHEMVEYFICKLRGVTIEDCNKFDAMYEEGYRSGKIPLDKEAGYDKRCPYHRGHVWGDRFAWVLAKLLRVKIKDYNRYMDKLITDEVKK